MENLENYGVQELNAQEMKKIEGGWIQILRAAAKILAASVAFDAWYQESGYIDRDMGIPFAA